MEQRLRQTLEQLHEELEQADSLDPGSRELLREVMGDIREALDRPQTSESASLLDRLREATGEFEESHPRLTAAVGRVADALSNLGI